MAIPTFVNFGVAATGTTAVSPALPASLLVDDILLLFIETANEAITIPTPNGGTWTEVTGSPQGTGTAAGLASTRLTVFWSRYNGTQGAPTTSDSGDHQIAQITAWRGCINTGNPWDVTAGDVLAAASTSVAIPGATTTVNDCLIVAIVSNATDTGTSQTGTWANASLSGVVERSDVSSTSGNGGGVGCASGGKAIAGAYSATTAVLATSSVQGRLSIALKPASSNAVALPGTGAPTFAGLAPLALLTIRIATGLGAPVFTGLAPTVIATNNIVIPASGLRYLRVNRQPSPSVLRPSYSRERVRLSLLGSGRHSSSRSTFLSGWANQYSQALRQPLLYQTTSSQRPDSDSQSLRASRRAWLQRSPPNREREQSHLPDSRRLRSYRTIR
jgi:hypothetical protein